MFKLFKNRSFSLLWFAGLISLTGNWMLIAALPFYVYKLTGSALATSGLMLAYILPALLFSSIAGVFVDRWDRRRTMVAVSLLQAAIIPVLILVRGPEWVGLIYLVAFTEAALGCFFSPAESALLPNLVPAEQLVSANSMNALNDNLARIIGPAIGGVLLGIVGFSSVILADAATYAIAALLIFLISAPVVERAKIARTAAKAGEKFLEVWTELGAGLKLVAGSRLLAMAFLVIGVALFADAIISAVLVVFVQDEMALSAVEFGWMMTARGLGGLIGGLLITQVGGKISKAVQITGGLVLTGLLILAMVQWPVLPVALPLLFLAGIPVMAWIVSLQTLLQQGTSDEYRGRVFGAFGTINALLMACGTLLAGGAADQLGAIILITAASGITIFAGILSWALLTKPVRELDLELSARQQVVASS